MNKIYKLLDTYIDVSNVIFINDTIILEERSNPKYSIVIDGKKILLGDSSKFEKFTEYSSEYSNWFSCYYSKKYELADILEKGLHKYTTSWYEEVKKQVKMFVEYWKEYHNQNKSNEYVRDH